MTYRLRNSLMGELGRKGTWFRSHRDWFKMQQQMLDGTVKAAELTI